MFGSDKCVDSGAGELSLIHMLLDEKFTQLILRSNRLSSGRKYLWDDLVSKLPFDLNLPHSAEEFFSLSLVCCFWRSCLRLVGSQISVFSPGWILLCVCVCVCAVCIGVFCVVEAAAVLLHQQPLTVGPRRLSRASAAGGEPLSPSDTPIIPSVCRCGCQWTGREAGRQGGLPLLLL